MILGGIDLYLVKFISQYDVCCCVVWASFRFECFVKIWATCEKFFWANGLPPPLAKNCLYAYVYFAQVYIMLACAADRTELLLKSICKTELESLVWVPTCVPGFEYVP